MNFELGKLYDEVYNNVSNFDRNTFLKQVELKVNLIENCEYADIEDQKKAKQIISDYGIMLYRAGYYRKAIHFLDLALKKFENDTNFKNRDLMDEPLFESLVFHHGSALFDLNKPAESRPDFRRLSNKFPENDSYRSMVRRSYYKIFNITELSFIFLATISIILSAYFKPEDGIIHIVSVVFIFIGIIGGLLIRYFRSRPFKTKVK